MMLCELSGEPQKLVYTSSSLFSFFLYLTHHARKGMTGENQLALGCYKGFPKNHTHTHKLILRTYT